MERRKVKQRENWAGSLEDIGFTFHSMGGGYWSEGVCYEFSSREIDHLEAVTDDLHEKCMEAVQYVIDKNLFDRMSIPGRFADLIKASWEREEVSLYGRFDFSYNGRGSPSFRNIMRTR